MPRTIRAGLRAYLLVGGVFAWFIIPSAAVWITRGGQTGAWKICAPASFLCLVCCFLLWRFALLVAADGITCTDFFGKVKYVEWSDIRRKILIRSRNQKPAHLRLMGESNQLLFSIPLGLCSRADSEYLMRDVFKVLGAYAPRKE